MFRKMMLFLMISCICPGNCFIEFKMDFIRDGYTCAHFAFVLPDTMISKCAAMCTTNPKCKRFFFRPEDNYCMGCSTFESQPSQASTSVGYVPGSHLTYRYLGCYTDYTVDRVLNGPMITADNMKNDFCFEYCIVDREYLYFGLQYYNQCFCGNSTQGGTKRPEDDCNTPCKGDQTQMCGGIWRNSIYELY